MLESGTERMVVLSNMEGCAKSFVLDKGYSSVGREGAKLRKLRISHPEHLSFASEADEQEERGCGNCRKGLFRTFFLSEQNL